MNKKLMIDKLKKLMQDKKIKACVIVILLGCLMFGRIMIYGIGFTAVCVAIAVLISEILYKIT